MPFFGGIGSRALGVGAGWALLITQPAWAEAADAGALTDLSRLSLEE